MAAVVAAVAQPLRPPKVAVGVVAAKAEVILVLPIGIPPGPRPSVFKSVKAAVVAARAQMAPRGRRLGSCQPGRCSQRAARMAQPAMLVLAARPLSAPLLGRSRVLVAMVVAAEREPVR